MSRASFPGCLLLGAAALLPQQPGHAAASALERAPAEPRAITVRGKADGRADDTDAIQHAIDQAAAAGAGGIVFLPSGRYRISHTLLVWPAVRVFGTGPTRPVL
ncbi:MAG TPA: glycosyl hydrolase family 28-related protein, partial [Steroidobacteraceae bacterium]|nr:glycosyl hydrolase family 28-related protein [Steroidobacteraceae bacterium]